MDYTKVIFNTPSSEVREVLIALLTHQGFDGFEEDDNQLCAYCTADIFTLPDVETIAKQNNVDFSIEHLAAQNWNRVWESNFQPVEVDDFCTIRADFHQQHQRTKHDIVITPKMSFGTGHHATTYMMIESMRDIEFREKKVLDFGTGTGVLAILAARLGAKEVLAVDNDEWSISNSIENIERNEVSTIRTLLADHADLPGKFDVILAIITRNVIVSNFFYFLKVANNNAVILLSGLLENDEPHIQELAERHRLQVESRKQKEKWLCLKLLLPETL